jgi:hypothetical protein
MEATFLGLRLIWAAGSRFSASCIPENRHFALEPAKRNVCTRARYSSTPTTDTIEIWLERFLIIRTDFSLLFNPSIPDIYRQDGATSSSYNHVGAPQQGAHVGPRDG